jgi:uncharacterized protein
MLVRASEAIAGGAASDRLVQIVAEFSTQIRNPRFPCFFAARALAEDEILFGLAESSPDLPGAITELMREASRAIRSSSKLVVAIFADVAFDATLAQEREFAGQVLRRLRQEDRVPWPPDAPQDPRDPRWVFWFEGVDFFINFSSPGHKCRRSRNLGSAFSMVVQSRSSFDDFGLHSKAREIVRSRLAGYDDLPPHPALGVYGDSANREILQYFLGDTNTDSWELLNLEPSELPHHDLGAR